MNTIRNKQDMNNLESYSQLILSGDRVEMLRIVCKNTMA